MSQVNNQGEEMSPNYSSSSSSNNYDNSNSNSNSNNNNTQPASSSSSYSRATVAGIMPTRIAGHHLVAMVIAAIVFSSGLLGVADGLKCHMCGQYNEGVGSITPCLNYTKDIAHLYLKECTKKSEKFCVKYVSELSTVRDCATECVEKEIWETQTYCCNEDGCNAGSQSGYSIILLILPLIYVAWSTCRALFKAPR